MPQGHTGTKQFAKSAPTGTAVGVLPVNRRRQWTLGYNAGSVTIYIGNDATVTTSSGFPVLAGAFFREKGCKDAYYAITAGSTGDLRMWTTEGDDATELSMVFSGGAITTAAISANNKLSHAGQTGNTVAGNVANQALGTVAVGALSAAATTTVTITDSQITTASLVFLAFKRGTTTAQAGAVGTLVAAQRLAGSGSLVVDVTNLGSAATLSTDYQLEYFVIN